MRFGDPLLLLLALPLLLGAVLALGRRSLSGLGPTRRRLALGSRVKVLALIVLALAEPLLEAEPERTHVVVALDVSRSIPGDQAALGREVAAAIGERADDEHTASLLLLGGDASVEGALEPGRRADDEGSSLVDRGATDLEAGLRRALEAVPPDARGRVLLVSDGNQTRGDALASAAAARRAGVPIDVAPLAYRLRDEVRVDKVVAPSSVAQGEPYVVRVVLESASDARAVLRLSRAGVVIERRPVVLAAGSNVETFHLVADAPGFTRLEAQVEHDVDRADRLAPVANPDARPQNDVAHAFVVVPGETRALHVTDEPDAARPLAAALAAQGVRLQTIAPADLPLEAGAYADVDAVVLDDVPREALTTRQVDALVDAVGDQGLGLLLTGGPRALGAGGWSGTRLEEASPVLFTPRSEVVIPDVGLVLVIDRSGSMSGEKLELAKQAAIAAARGLSSKDRIGVVAFDDMARWAFPLRPGGDPATVARLVGRIGDGGGTFLDPGLSLAHLGLRGVDTAVKHVIVLTDGRSAPGEPLQLAVRMAMDRITVSAVAVGSDADEELLRKLARAGGGQFYAVEKPADLPRIFMKETERVLRTLLRNESFTPVCRGESQVLRGLAAPATDEADALPPLPALDGFVLTERKPRAEVPLVGPDDAPLLAHAPFGLGRVLVFTADARSRWASRWLAWDGLHAFWSQALRWARRDVEASPLQVSVSRRGEDALVVVDAIDAAGDPQDCLPLSVRLRTPTGEERVAPLVQRGAGRYEARLAASEVGTHDVTVARDATSTSPARHVATTGLVVPYAAEHARLESDDALLAALADHACGQVLSPWDLREGKVDAWREDDLPPERAPREAWPLALALALVVFLLDVAIRRVSIDPASLWGKPTPLAAAALAAPGGAANYAALSRVIEHRELARTERVAHAPASVVEIAMPTAPSTPAPVPSMTALAPSTPGPALPAAEAPPVLSMQARLLAAKKRARGTTD